MTLAAKCLLCTNETDTRLYRFRFNSRNKQNHTDRIKEIFQFGCAVKHSEFPTVPICEIYQLYYFSDPPEFLIPKDKRQHFIASMETDNVTFSCLVRGGAPLRYRWFYNGRLLKSGKDHEIRESELIVRNVQRADNGIYTCKIKNGYGHIKHSFKLKVLGKFYFLLARCTSSATLAVSRQILIFFHLNWHKHGCHYVVFYDQVSED